MLEAQYKLKAWMDGLRMEKAEDQYQRYKEHLFDLDTLLSGIDELLITINQMRPKAAEPGV